MPTPGRLVRIPDELWEAALAAAEADGTTVSDLIRDGLRRYLRSRERRARDAGRADP